MKELFIEIRNYLRSYFEWKSHLAVVLLLAVLVTINYTVGIEGAIRSFVPRYKQIPFFIALYGAVYFLSVYLIKRFDKGFYLKKPRQFVGFVLFMLVLWALKRAFPFSREFSRLLGDWHENRVVFFYISKLLINLNGLFIFILPALLFYAFRKWSVEPWFGLRTNWKGVKPYFILILLMLPLLVAASFLPDFQKAYPLYRDYGEYAVLGYPKWLSVLIYEFSYGLFFLKIEFVMRGVFVLGMAYFLGPRAVLPMAAFYLTIHFGKPLGETISSFFGGYILGILTLHSRHIYGGLIVHVGIAWLMELLAFLQKA